MSEMIRKSCSASVLALLLATIFAACSTPSIPASLSSSTASTPNASSIPSPLVTPESNISGITGPSEGSRNWSGYAATNGTFTSVTGSWTIPQVSPNGHASADATWIGIGGISSQDLIQSGTQNIISNIGQTSTSAFFELLPADPQTIPVTVQSGDTIVVSITELSTNQWQISFQDTTNGQSYHTTTPYTSSLSSAEWIEEAPSDGHRTIPLDNFGMVQFSSGSVTKNGNMVTISASNAQQIIMTNTSGQLLAIPSSLGSDGASFTVTRSSAISSPPNPELDRSTRGWRRHGFGMGRGG